MSRYKELSEDFVSKYFFTYSQGAKYLRAQGIYQGGCPICKEGKSWGSKHRCYYIPRENRIYCHNCHWPTNGSGKPINWISEVTGKSFKEIYAEFKESSTDLNVAFAEKEEIKNTGPIVLPHDSFNLFDEEVIDRYHQMGRHDFDAALEYITTRGLDRAVNRGELYFSFNDYTHYGRIIIPFFNEFKKLLFFQSRSVGSKPDELRYISSRGYDKTLYGMERIDFSKDYFFIQEGPLDTFFLKNSVAIGGINPSKRNILTHTQREQMTHFIGMTPIFILDNPNVDAAAAGKIDLINEIGYSYFVWPNNGQFNKQKDLNDYCLATGINEVSEEFIVTNSVIRGRT